GRLPRVLVRPKHPLAQLVPRLRQPEAGLADGLLGPLARRRVQVVEVGIDQLGQALPGSLDVLAEQIDVLAGQAVGGEGGGPPAPGGSSPCRPAREGGSGRGQGCPSGGGGGARGGAGGPGAGAPPARGAPLGGGDAVGAPGKPPPPGDAPAAPRVFPFPRL